MTAYVIVDIEVSDPEGYKEYVKLAPEAVKLYGGKYIARGGYNETLEGHLMQLQHLNVSCFKDTDNLHTICTRIMIFYKFVCSNYFIKH